jgi:hypothetical protein
MKLCGHEATASSDPLGNRIKINCQLFLKGFVET